MANLCPRYVYITMIHSTRLHLQGRRGPTINECTGVGRDIVVIYVNGICTGFGSRLRHVLTASFHRRSLVIIHIVFLVSCKDILLEKKGSLGMSHLLSVSTSWTQDV